MLYCMFTLLLRMALEATAMVFLELVGKKLGEVVDTASRVGCKFFWLLGN